MERELDRLAADMAEALDLPIPQTLVLLLNAIRGESEPLRAFG